MKNIVKIIKTRIYLVGKCENSEFNELKVVDARFNYNFRTM